MIIFMNNNLIPENIIFFAKFISIFRKWGNENNNKNDQNFFESLKRDR